jgi:IS5 family transposase
MVRNVLSTNTQIHLFVQFLGYMRAYFHLAFRQTEGVVVQGHAGKKVPSSIPDYSTISRRVVNKLDIKVNEKEEVGNDIVIALDSTGIKVSNRGGEWMRHKWNVRSRGYLKIHVAVDIRKKKVVSLQVTSEEVHDSKMLKKLVKAASENNDVKRVLADGAYDSKKNFRYLSDNGIEAEQSR